MRTLRVGIVASGMMAKNHADALHRVPGVEVVAIADSCAKDLEQVAKQLGIPHAFSSYEEMCERMQLDMIHNCTPNSEHFSINKYAIVNGIGIYSEKPLAVSVAEAEELCALLEQYKVPNGVNFNYRSNAIVREMRARIREEKAGSPLLIHGSYLQDWLMYEHDFNWRLDSSKGGKSRAVADIGSHWFDTAQVIMDSRITKVFANLLTVYPNRLKPTEETETFSKNSNDTSYEKVPIDTEDVGMIMVQFENGTYGDVLLSQVSGGYKNELSISVDCSKCSLRWNQEEPDHLFVGDREQGVTKTYAAAGGMTEDANFYALLPGGHPVGWNDALYNNFRLFYGSLQQGNYGKQKQEYATFQDATYIMKIVEACLKSSEQKQWVEV